MLGTIWKTPPFPRTTKLVRVVVTGFREHPKRTVRVAIANNQGEPVSAYWFVAPADLRPVNDQQPA